MRLQSSIFIFLICVSALYSCTSGVSAPAPTVGIHSTSDFGDYWFQGKAEITSYALNQARYGEMRSGNAVAVFVTEPFSRKKKVKLDDPDRAGSDKVDVLKLNFTRDFNTGVYPYSLMTSVFTPILQRPNRQSSLKTTCSVTEWCGQAFMQVTAPDEASFEFVQHSYFEDEERHGEIASAWLEDELWTLIRIAPDQLPNGTIQMIPASHYLRLLHKEFKPLKAEASITELDSLRQLAIRYPEDGRELTVLFSASFPYEIEEWTETYVDGWGASAQKLTTTGKKIKRMQLDYWTKNSNADADLREELGLD